jgi:hypothetical protein
MKGLNGQRAEYERRANELRAKLLHTISAIEQRRHGLLDVKQQVRRHAGGVLATVVTSALVASALVVVAVHRARERVRERRGERVRALARVWRHPDWVAQQTRPSVAREIGRRVVVGVMTFLATQLLRRGIRLALEPGREAPRGGPLVLREPTREST